MNRFAMAGVVWLLAAGAAMRADDKALEAIEGTYKVTAMAKGARDVPPEVRVKVSVKIKGDEIALVLPDRTMTAKIKLNPDKKTIDISPTEGPEKGKTFPGIYKVDTDELVIAFREKGDRPTEFKTEGETTLMKLKKEKD